jgi:hypothetical protein
MTQGIPSCEIEKLTNLAPTNTVRVRHHRVWRDFLFSFGLSSGWSVTYTHTIVMLALIRACFTVLL